MVEDGVSFEIQGLSELQAKLSDLGDKAADRAIRAALRAGAEIEQVAISERAPIKDRTGGTLPDGALKNDIVIRIKKDQFGGLSATIGPDKLTKHVAGWVEYGHRLVRGGKSRLLPNGKIKGPGKQIDDVPAHPFIRPAWEATRQEVTSAITTTLVAEIEKSAARKRNNMSVDAAGGVNIVLNLKTSTYTAAMAEAQAQLDKFSGKTKEAGHSTVSSMQAASGAIREMNGNFAQNTRAVERFITTIPGVGSVLQAAFPLIGGLAFGAMIVDAGMKVAKFIEAANKMPAAIKQGFESLHLSALASNDALKLTDDLLQNHINKLQGKSQNNLAIQLDEARIKADDLAKSLANDAEKVQALLEKNKIGNLAGMLTGKAGTTGVSGTVNYGLQEIQHLAYLNRQAVGTPGADQAFKNLADKQDYYQNWTKRQLFLRDNPQYATDGDQDMGGDQVGNRNILLGFQDVLGDQKSTQAEKDRNAQLVPQGKAAEAASEAAKKAAEAARKAAEEMAKGWSADAEVLKLWTEYGNKNSKTWSEDSLDEWKTNGLSSDDNKQLDQSGAGSLARITAMRQSIDLSKQNSDALAESALQMQIATGQISKMDAAQLVATRHTKQYNDALQKLKDQAADIASDKSYTSDEARQAALINNKNAQNGLNTTRQIQVGEDNQNINPASSSASAGFDDAINGFVIASRDAASQMRDLTTNTLHGLNAQLVAAMSGQKTSFGNFGAGVARSVAGTALEKGEGSVMGMFGGGKLGTKGNPMIVQFADGSSSANGGLLSGLFGGGSKGPGASGLASAMNFSQSSSDDDAAGGGIGTIASSLTDMIPFLASGGPIDGPAVVGEQGPEIFNPGRSGTIIPNHKLKTLGGGAGTTIHIDASGSTDPAQTRVQVMRGIQAAAPHIAASAINAQQQDNRRRPRSTRR